MCGEHYCDGQELFRGRGSSPHVRGARCCVRYTIGDRGIIPACAGSTESVCDALVANWDHPRMCGEHPKRGHMARPSTGSSPHVRGALRRTTTTSTPPGIIPACAGSTRPVSKTPPSNWDHPRMCGEHRSIVGIGVACQGSSPHVRGAPPAYSIVINVSGIIPACAGSTDTATAGTSKTRDHPRMCGEHSKPGRCVERAAGSSPHVRGAL